MKKEIKIHNPFDKPSLPGNEGHVGDAKHPRINSIKKLVQLEIEYPPFVTCDNVGREPSGAYSAKRSEACIAKDERTPTTPVWRGKGRVIYHSEPREALMSLIY